MIIDNLASLPSAITTGDELPVERGTTVYKIDYNTLAAAILSRNSLIDTWAAQSTNVVSTWNANFLASGNATVAYDYRGTLHITVQGVTTKTGTDWVLRLRSDYRENFSSTADAYFTCYLGNTPSTCYLTHDGFLYAKNLNTTDLLSIDIAVAMV